MIDPRYTTPKVGSRLHLDGWQLSAGLGPCEWDRADFRLTDASLPLAVKVETTGRTVQRFRGELAVRVRVTFVGDGEPDVMHGAWMFLND